MLLFKQKQIHLHHKLRKTHEISQGNSCPSSYFSSRVAAGETETLSNKNVGALPKLCNPVAIAVVHRDHLDYLEKICLPFMPGTISGEQFFHRIVQHCSANKGNNFVLVFIPFKSTTIKVDGVPVVVRQVSSMLQFWSDFSYKCPFVLWNFFLLP